MHPSYVTAEKVYCIHEAESEDVIREHAACSGFPITRIEEITGVINPATADYIIVIANKIGQ